MESSIPYEKLLPDEDGQSQGLCPYCERAIYPRTLPYVKIFLAFVACDITLAIFAIAGYIALQNSSVVHSFDQYWDFLAPNATAQVGIRNAADVSSEAAQFWKDIQATNGIVMVDSKAAEHMNLPSTRSHPNDASSKIYQINFFHSIHCLYRIRSRLVSEVPLEQWPRNDAHTLHCIDHIRENLMCQPDLSLHGTRDYVVYDTAPDDKKCRDLSAIRHWTAAHAWSGYSEYWDRFDWGDIESRIQDELSRHPGIRWDQYRDFYDPDLPFGFRLEFEDSL